MRTDEIDRYQVRKERYGPQTYWDMWAHKAISLAEYDRARATTDEWTPYQVIQPFILLPTPKFHTPALDLDLLPPEIEKIISASSKLIGGTPDYALAAFLSTAALALQKDHVVITPYAQTPSALALFFVVIGEPSEGKSTTEGIFFTPIMNKEDELRKRARGSSLDIGSLKRILDREIRQFENSMDRSDPLQVKKHKELVESRSQQLRQIKLIYQSVTSKQLLVGLQQWPSAAMLSAESGAQTETLFARDISFFTRLFSKEPIRIENVEQGEVTVSNASLVMCLFTQRAYFERLVKRSNGIAQNSGLLSRMLISYPASTRGTKLEIPKHDATDKLVLNNHNELIAKLLDRSYERDNSGQTQALTVSFSEDAAQKWEMFRRDLEYSRKDGEPFSAVKHMASKLAEITARIAAVMQLYLIAVRGGVEKLNEAVVIDLVTLNSAIGIALYHAEHQNLLFGTEKRIFYSQDSANQLLEYMRTHAKRNPGDGQLYYRKSAISNKISIAKDPEIREILFKILVDEKKISYRIFSNQSGPWSGNFPNGEYVLIHV